MSASVNAAFGRIPHFLYVLVDSFRRPQGSPYSALSLGRQWIHVGGGVHSSSCGTHHEVVHSPLDWFYHRCHCNYRDRRQTALTLRPYVLPESLRRDFVWWWFYSWWCLRFCLGQCEADDWKIHLIYFQFQEVVGCVCMLNYWFSSNDDICTDNCNYSRFQLKDKCRSEKWEVCLYGDMTIMVVRSQVQFLAV